MGPERRGAARTAPNIMPFVPKERLFPIGCGEYALGVCLGDGGSGDQAKPMGLPAAPTGDAARPIGVLAERPPAAVAGDAWQDLPVRGENVTGACVQLKPPAGARGMPPVTGLGVRIVGRMCGMPGLPTASTDCIGEADRAIYRALPVALGGLGA